jgi:hypothetical protein
MVLARLAPPCPVALDVLKELARAVFSSLDPRAAPPSPPPSQEACGAGAGAAEGMAQPSAVLAAAECVVAHAALSLLGREKAVRVAQFLRAQRLDAALGRPLTEQVVAALEGKAGAVLIEGEASAVSAVSAVSENRPPVGVASETLRPLAHVLGRLLALDVDAAVAFACPNDDPDPAASGGYQRDLVRGVHTPTEKKHAAARTP